MPFASFRVQALPFLKFSLVQFNEQAVVPMTRSFASVGTVIFEFFFFRRSDFLPNLLPNEGKVTS